MLNEAIRNGPVVMQQMPRTKPGTLVGLSGGGLGFSGGMALGLKLAWPERTVVQVVGDGTSTSPTRNRAWRSAGNTSCRC